MNVHVVLTATLAVTVKFDCQCLGVLLEVVSPKPANESLPAINPYNFKREGSQGLIKWYHANSF